MFIIWSCDTGTSFSDHKVLYQHLITRLVTKVTPHIVTLRSHDCCSGMSAIVKAVHTQLMKGWIPDREKMPQQGSSQQKTLPRLTISTLLSWHLNNMVNQEICHVKMFMMKCLEII